MNYPYANGTIKALETKILDRSKLFVLAKYDKSEFVKVLVAMNYGNNDATVEELIASEMQKTKALIDEVTPDKENTDLFYLVNDAVNIKLLYKIKKFDLGKNDNFDLVSLLQNNGSIPISDLKKIILEDKVDDSELTLTKKQRKLFTLLNENTKDITSPKELSIKIDKVIYEYALKTNNSTLKTYLVTKLDLINVLSFLRSKNLKWDFSKFEEMFIKGGLISFDVYQELYNLNNEIIVKRFEAFYNEKISQILAHHFNDFNSLEVLFDNLLLDVMKSFKDEPLTIGPMIYYYLLKQVESQNIRTLYSKENVEMKDLGSW